MKQELEDWLDIATQQCSADQRHQFREEIIAHYEDAVHSYQAQGLPAEAAHKAALADLGDPYTTALAFLESPSTHSFLQSLPRYIGHFWNRHRRSMPSVLLVLALLINTPHLLDGQYSDIGLLTGIALIVQVATLALVLCIPLAFDDLDLSAGVMVMLGALVARMFGGIDQPVDLVPALMLAGSLGLGIGLMHGVLASLVRAPTALITLISAGGVAFILAQFEQISNLAIHSGQRQELLLPSLVLFGGVATLCVLVLGRTPRSIAPERAVFQSIAKADRRLLWSALAVVLAPFVLVMGLVNMTGGARFWVMVLVGIALALAMLTTLIVPRAADTPQQSERRRRHQQWLVRSIPLWVAGYIACAIGWSVTGTRAGMPGLSILSMLVAPLLLALPIACVVVAMIILLHQFAHSPGRHWFSAPSFRRHSASLILRRILALMLCSGIAAILGVYTVAQGIRDNTYVMCASFYILTPLAALIIGGQHLLSGRRRAVHALLGALATALFCTPLGSDNLAQGGVAALLLAALMALVWRTPAKGAAPALGEAPLQSKTKPEAPIHRVA